MDENGENEEKISLIKDEKFKKFVCPRCNYSSNFKTDLKRHFNRTIPCENINKIECNDDIKNEILYSKNKCNN